MGIPVFEQHVDEYGNVSVRVSQDIVVLTRDDADRVKARFDQLKTENARLRELVRELLPCYMWSDCFGKCTNEDGRWADCPKHNLQKVASELGVDVTIHDRD